MAPGKTVPEYVNLGVVPNAVQGSIDRVLVHRLSVGVVARKDQLVLVGELAYLIKQHQHLPVRRNEVKGSHIGSASRVFAPINRDSLARNGPQRMPEVDFRPVGKAQFAGANEYLQGELGC